MIKIQSFSNPENLCILGEIQKQRRNRVQPADTMYFNVRITAALEIVFALKVEEQGNEIHCWRSMSIMRCAETAWKQLITIWKSRFASLSSPTWFAERVSSHCSHLASQMLSLSLTTDSFWCLIHILTLMMKMISVNWKAKCILHFPFHYFSLLSNGGGAQCYCLQCRLSWI